MQHNKNPTHIPPLYMLYIIVQKISDSSTMIRILPEVHHYPGLRMYVVFVETVSPQALLDTMQQTPGGLVRAVHLQRMNGTFMKYFEMFDPHRIQQHNSHLMFHFCCCTRSWERNLDFLFCKFVSCILYFWFLKFRFCIIELCIFCTSN